MVTFVTFLYFIVTIPLSALAVPVAQSNILIPNENGELVYATPSQLAAREVKSMKRSLLKRDACSDQTVPSDYFTCMQYCERSSAVVQGPAVKVSAAIDCTVGTTGTCGVNHVTSVTITESFSIDLGATSPAGETGDATLTAGASFSWSKSSLTGNTYTFTPSTGDQGYIAFKPNLHQSCGDFQVYTFSQSGDGSIIYCDTPISAEDPNACGTTPMSLSSGEADGTYSFCRPNGDGC